MVKIKTCKGLTLIEIMVSTVILLLVLGSLLYTFTNSMILNEQNSGLFTATNDAQYVLEQMKALAFDDISSYSAPNFTNLNNESVSVECTTGLYSGPCSWMPGGANLVNVAVNITWIERQRTRSKQLTTAIARTAQ